MSGHGKITRSLRHETDEKGEQSGRNHLRSKHVTPSCLNGPGCLATVKYLVHAIADALYGRSNVVAKDEEIDKIHHQLTEDDGKLVPRHEHATDVAGGNLADIHRAYGRSKSHANTTYHTVNIKDDEQGEIGLALS